MAQTHHYSIRNMTLPGNLRDLFLLDPEITYLNHGSFGATPRPVFDRYQEIQREFESRPVYYHARQFNDVMRGARQVLGDYVNADPLDLVYVTNVTVAVNIVARSLKLGAGDELLTTDHEYGACDYTWEQQRRAHGFEVKRVTLPVPVSSKEEIIERVVAGMNDRTRVLFISHITSPTAITLPIVEICRAARERGIITVVDGAHAIGQIPLDLRAIDPDYYTSNLHKWLCAPKGSAFFYARRDMQERIEPLVTSWGYEPVKEYDSRFIAHHEYRGTREIAAPLSTEAAITFQREHDWEGVRRSCHSLLQEYRPLLAERFGWEPLVSLGVEETEPWFTQMAAFLLPEEIDAFAMKERLYDEERIEIPVFAWNGRETIRVSMQGYNDRDDLERLIEGLDRVLYGA